MMKLLYRTKRMSRYGFIAFFYFFIFPAKGQHNGEDHLGAWYMYFGTHQVSDRWSLSSEAQIRYYEVADRFNQLLLRTGANYKISDKATASVGYGYIVTDGTFAETEGERNSHENRIFEQFVLRNNLGKVNLQHRYRLEQRFLHLANGKHDLQQRARYRLQATFPLNNTLFLNFYDEVFLNLQGDVFGQNRVYGALGARFSDQVSIQMGYQKNHFTPAHYDRLQLGVFLNTDLRKKKEQD